MLLGVVGAVDYTVLDCLTRVFRRRLFVLIVGPSCQQSYFVDVAAALFCTRSTCTCPTW